jgi:ElaB/YqjD/DUF883 family membrane-anchored ribosome-binding protein
MADENVTNLGGGMTAAEDKLESSTTHAQRAAGDLKSATASMATEYQNKAEQSLEETKRRVRSWQEEGEEYVRAKPMKAVFIALGIGFVLSRMLRR